MSKIEFIYGKGGKKVMMARRYAETLQKLGHGQIYETRMMTAAPPPPPVDAEPLVSEAVAKFAEDHSVDIKLVVGTGKDGRINKSDVEAVIAAKE